MLLPSCNCQMVKAEQRYSPLGILLIHTCSTVHTCAWALLPCSSSGAQKWGRCNFTGYSSKNLQHTAVVMAYWITLMIFIKGSMNKAERKVCYTVCFPFIHKFISCLNDFWLAFMRFTWKQRITTSLYEYFTTLHIVAAIWLDRVDRGEAEDVHNL